MTNLLDRNITIFCHNQSDLQSNGIYNGTYNLDGEKHGSGTLVYSNGRIYSGEFQNDMQHGQGQVKLPTILVNDREFNLSGFTGLWHNGNKWTGKYNDLIEDDHVNIIYNGSLHEGKKRSTAATLTLYYKKHIITIIADWHNDQIIREISNDIYSQTNIDIQELTKLKKYLHYKYYAKSILESVKDYIYSEAKDFSSLHPSIVSIGGSKTLSSAHGFTESTEIPQELLKLELPEPEDCALRLAQHQLTFTEITANNSIHTYWNLKRPLTSLKEVTTAPDTQLIEILNCYKTIEFHLDESKAPSQVRLYNLCEAFQKLYNLTNSVPELKYFARHYAQVIATNRKDLPEFKSVITDNGSTLESTSDSLQLLLVILLQKNLCVRNKSDWHSQVNILQAIATICSKLNLVEFSNQYFQRALTIFLKNHKELYITQKDENLIQSQVISQEIKTLDAQELTEYLERVRKVHIETEAPREHYEYNVNLEDLDTQELNILLMHAYGSWDNEELFITSQNAALNEIESFFKAKKIQELVAIITTTYKNRVPDEMLSKVPDLFKRYNNKKIKQLKKYLNEAVNAFFLNIEHYRIQAIEQFEHLEKDVYKHINTYEFISATTQGEFQKKYLNFYNAKIKRLVANEDRATLNTLYKEFLGILLITSVIDQNLFNKMQSLFKLSVYNHNSYIWDQIQNLQKFGEILENPIKMSIHEADTNIIKFEVTSGSIKKIFERINSLTLSNYKHLEIWIIASNNIYYDKHLDDKFLSGTNIALLSPNHILILPEKCRVITSGAKAVKEFYWSTANHGKTPNKYGGHGTAGESGADSTYGNPGGNILIFTNQADTVNIFDFKANGSDATVAQNGGNGGYGYHGEDGTEAKKYFNGALTEGSKWYAKQQYTGRVTERFNDYPQIERDTNNVIKWNPVFYSVYCIALGTNGSDGGKAGAAGDGGARGLGGAGGKIKIICAQLDMPIKIRTQPGANSEAGSIGQTSYDGRHGVNQKDYLELYPVKGMFTTQPEPLRISGRFIEKDLIRDKHKFSFSGQWWKNLTALEKSHNDDDDFFTEHKKPVKSGKVGITRVNENPAKSSTKINKLLCFNSIAANITNNKFCHNETSDSFLLGTAQLANKDFMINRLKTRLELMQSNTEQWHATLQTHMQHLEQYIESEQQIQSEIQIQRRFTNKNNSTDSTQDMLKAHDIERIIFTSQDVNRKLLKSKVSEIKIDRIILLIESFNTGNTDKAENLVLIVDLLRQRALIRILAKCMQNDKIYSLISSITNCILIYLPFTNEVVKNALLTTEQLIAHFAQHENFASLEKKLKLCLLLTEISSADEQINSVTIQEQIELLVRIDFTQQDQVDFALQQIQIIKRHSPATFTIDTDATLSTSNDKSREVIASEYCNDPSPKNAVKILIYANTNKINIKLMIAEDKISNYFEKLYSYQHSLVGNHVNDVEKLIAFTIELKKYSAYETDSSQINLVVFMREQVSNKILTLSSNYNNAASDTLQSIDNVLSDIQTFIKQFIFKKNTPSFLDKASATVKIKPYKDRYKMQLDDFSTTISNNFEKLRNELFSKQQLLSWVKKLEDLLATINSDDFFQFSKKISSLKTEAHKHIAFLNSQILINENLYTAHLQTQTAKYLPSLASSYPAKSKDEIISSLINNYFATNQNSVPLSQQQQSSIAAELHDITHIVGMRIDIQYDSPHQLNLTINGNELITSSQCTVIIVDAYNNHIESISHYCIDDKEQYNKLQDSIKEFNTSTKNRTAIYIGKIKLWPSILRDLIGLTKEQIQLDDHKIIALRITGSTNIRILPGKDTSVTLYGSTMLETNADIWLPAQNKVAKIIESHVQNNLHSESLELSFVKAMDMLCEHMNELSNLQLAQPATYVQLLNSFPEYNKFLISIAEHASSCNNITYLLQQNVTLYKLISDMKLAATQSQKSTLIANHMHLQSNLNNEEILNIAESNTKHEPANKGIIINRLLDCYLQVFRNTDLQTIQNVHRLFLRLNRDICSLVYNKFTNEVFNPSQGQTEVKFLQMLTPEHFLSILNLLNKINLSTLQLVELYETPIVGWHNWLQERHFVQACHKWPLLVKPQNKLYLYKSNSIRVNLDKLSYDNYLKMINIMQHKSANVSDSIPLAIFDAVSNHDVTIDQADEIVHKYEASNWTQQIMAHMHKRDDSKPLSITEIINELMKSTADSKQHSLFAKIGQQATAIRTMIDKRVNDFKSSDIKSVTDNYFKKLGSMSTPEQRKQWLFDKDENGQQNILTFITLLCTAWSHNDPKNVMPRDIQIISVLMFLNSESSAGMLQQVKTGEGKTLIIGLFSAAKSLLGYNVDMVSSNEDLAVEACKKSFKFLEFLDIHAGVNIKNKEYNSGSIYQKNIVYGVASSFQGDICDERQNKSEIFGDRYTSKNKKYCIIVDEVDSLSLDNATSMLYLSHNFNGFKHLDNLLLQIRALVLKHLSENKDTLSDLVKNITAHAEHIYFKLLPNPDSKFNPELKIPKYMQDFCKTQLKQLVQNCFQAEFMQRDHSYIVKEDKIVVMNMETGIEAYTTNYSEGLHQFLQLKEGLALTTMGLHATFISNKTFFQSYGSEIFGLSGTLGSKNSKDFLSKVYGTTDAKGDAHDLNLVELPSFKPRRFKLTPHKVIDTSKNTQAWEELVANTALDYSEEQPVLIICKTVDDTNNVIEQLKAKGHEPVTYKSEEDNNIELRFGEVGGAKKRTIIVATNKGGRGTDIPVDLKNSPKGLHIILSYIPDNSRIEEQAFGRAARSGDPGTGNFVVKVEQDSGELAEIQIDKIIREREAQEEKRLIHLKTAEVPRVDLREALSVKYRALVADYREALKKIALPMDTLKRNYAKLFNISGKVDKLSSRQLRTVDVTLAYLENLDNRWAFWLNSIESEIRNIKQFDATIIDMLMKKMQSEFIGPLKEKLTSIDKIINELPVSPEECIEIGNIYIHNGEYAKGLNLFNKAIVLGDYTGYAAKAAALCYLRSVDQRKDAAKHKKESRRFVKYANAANTEYLFRTKLSLTYLSWFQTAVQQDANNTSSSITSKNMQQRTGALSLHQSELEKIIGVTIKPEDFATSNVGGTSLTSEDSVKIYNKLVDNNWIAKNRVRRRWLKRENHAALKVLINTENQGIIDPHLLFEMLQAKDQKDFSENKNFDSHILCCEDLWQQLISAQLLNAPTDTTFAMYIRLPINLPDNISIDIRNAWVEICKDINLSNGSQLYNQHSDVYKQITNNQSLMELFVKLGYLQHGKTAIVPQNFSDKLTEINLAKYQDVTIPLGNEITTMKIALQAVFSSTEIKDLNGNKYIFDSMLPFTATHSMQKSLLLKYLEGVNIIKNGALLNKYCFDNDTTMTRIKQLFDKEYIEFHEHIVNKLEDMRGDLRSFVGTIVAHFVSNEDVIPKDSKSTEDNMDFEYFTSMYLDIFLELSLKKSIWNWKIGVIAMLGLVQAIAGIVIICGSGGAGALVGAALLQMAFNDFCYAYKASSSATFSWKDYGMQKAFSTALSCASALAFAVGGPACTTGLEYAMQYLLKVAVETAVVYLAETITREMLNEFSGAVISHTVDKTCRPMFEHCDRQVNTAFSKIYREHNGNRDVYIHGARAINRRFAEDINYITTKNDINVALVSSITSATESACKMIGSLLKVSQNKYAKTIGSVISAAGTAATIASHITEFCQFTDTQRSMESSIDKIVESILKCELSAMSEQHRNTSLSKEVAADAAFVHNSADAVMRMHVRKIIDNIVRKVTGLHVSNLARQEGNRRVQSMQRQSAATQRGINSLATMHETSHNISWPESEQEMSEMNKTKITPDMLKVILATTTPIYQSIDSEQDTYSRYCALQYTKALYLDPYGVFELQLVASKENASLHIINKQWQYKHSYYSQCKSQSTTSHYAVAEIIDMDVKYFSPVIANPRKNSQQTYTISNQMLMGFDQYKSLLAATIFQVSKKTPSKMEFIKYRQELLRFSIEAKHFAYNNQNDFVAKLRGNM